MPRTVERVPKTVQTFEEIATYTCDKCGEQYEEDAYFVSELEVWLDREECVSYGHKRYYCGNCTKPIWDGICALIGANPDSEHKSGFEDDDE
jgi:hypothetical protein